MPRLGLAVLLVATTAYAVDPKLYTLFPENRPKPEKEERKPKKRYPVEMAIEKVYWARDGYSCSGEAYPAIEGKCRVFEGVGEPGGRGHSRSRVPCGKPFKLCGETFNSCECRDESL